MNNNTEKREEDLKRAVVDFGRLLAQGRRAREISLKRLASLQKRKAERLEGLSGRLAETLGGDHPRVGNLMEKAAEARGLQKALVETHTFDSKLPTMKRTDWVVLGRITDEAGKALPHLRVRVVAPGRKSEPALPDAETDADGDFSVVHHARDFGDVIPETELNLVVEDARGKVLHTVSKTLRHRVGGADFLSIVIKEKRSAKPPRR